MQGLLDKKSNTHLSWHMHLGVRIRHADQDPLEAVSLAAILPSTSCALGTRDYVRGISTTYITGSDDEHLD